MKVLARHAVVSWCPDLTSPSAKALPLAVLLVARHEKHSFATAVAFEFGDESDPVTAAVLNDVSVVIRSHVDAITSKGGSTDDVLEKLATSLRGSLHVASISDAREVTIADTMELVSTAHEILMREIQPFVKGAEPSASVHSETTTPQAAKSVPLPPGFSEVPSGMQQWRIPPPGKASGTAGGLMA